MKVMGGTRKLQRNVKKIRVGFRSYNVRNLKELIEIQNKKTILKSLMYRLNL